MSVQGCSSIFAVCCSVAAGRVPAGRSGGDGQVAFCADPFLPLPFFLQGVPFPQNEANAMDVVVQFAIHRLGFQPQDIIIYAWSIGGFTGTSLPPTPATVGTFKPSLCPPRRGGEMHWWPRSGVEASRRRGGTGVGSLSASGRNSPFSPTLRISFHPCARLLKEVDWGPGVVTSGSKCLLWHCLQCISLFSPSSPGRALAE